jgi:hypothetical protein
MARLVPFYRNVDVVRARRNKSLLLPLSCVEADKLSLSVHAALDALRRGRAFKARIIHVKHVWIYLEHQAILSACHTARCVEYGSQTEETSC